MGCDIHFFTERYSTDDYDGPKDLLEERDQKIGSVLDGYVSTPRWITADKWTYEHDDKYWGVDYQLYEGRNYHLFNILAGVRGDGPTISEPRGVPEDASYAYRVMLNQWGWDAHSASYYTLSELLKVNWEEYKYLDYLDEFMDTIENMKKIDPNPDNVRCVFFFDN